ncbi:hypothetical protein N9B72_02135, partial [Bacteriovoracaceae bacterium]|nr:hypothetical protein [Bacteriovoracaceae bacterium]
QVTSSVPRESFFQLLGTKGAIDASNDISDDVMEKMVQTNVGYFNVVNDLDTMEKMASGYKRFLDDPNSLTGKSFAHPWLGPMNIDRHDKLVKLVDDMAHGKSISEDQVSNIAIQIDSHKFIGGSVFRPDVARKQNRMAIEIRNCHKNPICLESQLKREIYFYKTGKEAFLEANSLKQFDRQAAWGKVGNEEQKMLKKLFPKYGSYRSDHTAVYLNFSYPFRDWEQHIKLFDAQDLTASIKEAQDIYLGYLTSIRKSLAAGEIDKLAAKAQVQGALNKFIVDSNLYESTKKFYQKSVGDDFKELDFIKLTYLLIDTGVLYV